MRIAWSVVTLICGIAVVVGVFLPWVDLGWGMTLSGWDGIKVSIPDAVEPFLALVGGAVMAVFCLPAFIVSVASRGGRAAVLTLGIFATLAALVAIGGAVWWIVDAGINDAISLVGYGVYISAVAAVLGLIFGILTAAFSKG